MFALLGTIKIDAVRNGLTASEHNLSFTYAEHAVFKEKPVLQRIAPNLKELNLTMSLNYQSGSVQSRINHIESLLYKAVPFSFVMGNGRFVGVFVLESFSIMTTIADDRGGLMGADLNLSLREYVGKIKEDSPLSGIAHSALGAIGSANSLLNEVTGVANQTLNRVNGALDTATQVISNIGLLGAIIPKLSEAQDPLEMIRSILNITNGTLDLTQNVLGLSLPFGDAITAFLNDFERIFSALKVVNDNSLAALHDNTIVPYLGLLDTAYINLASGAVDLTIDRANVSCEIGKRII